ncbi:MAG: hypothetical protein WB699_13205, partial [Bacteroidota bacterium]
AEPIGVLVAETLPHDMAIPDRSALQAGIRGACLATGTAVLGGDTNFSNRLHMGGTGIGIIREGTPMTRVGCKPGDELFSTGLLGKGNAFAAARFANLAAGECPYQPVARIPMGLMIRPFAAACMDTSDGLLATLDQLGRLNGVGFRLGNGWREHIAPDALQVAATMGLSPWTLFAGPHGEFELIFAVRPDRVIMMTETLKSHGCVALHLGRVTGTPGVGLDGWGFLDPEALALLRNRRLRDASDVAGFRDFLTQMEGKLKISTYR